MKRRDFIEKVSSAALAIQFAPLDALSVNTDVTIKLDKDIYTGAKRISSPSGLQDSFIKLLRVLKEKKWIEFLNIQFNIDLDPDNPDLNLELDKVIPDITKKYGFDDFAGIRMIEPGRPSMSLLFHALASPRIHPKILSQPFENNQYLDYEQINLLEDYIYSLLKLDIDDKSLEEEYVFAVFSYEYRTAYKTPDCSPYADFVFSRTGISRIGQHSYNYDRKSRSFVNLPKDANPKEIAVMPAKYGLFLAKITKAHNVNLMSEERYDTRGFPLHKKSRDFLVPVRKIFENDPLLNGAEIIFYESHVNEKLARLCKFESIENLKDKNTDYDLHLPPFKKINSTNDKGIELTGHNSNMVSLSKNGSSVLLIPVANDLIRFAKHDNKLTFFKVPPKQKLLPFQLDSSRRYTSLKLQTKPFQNALDAMITEGMAKYYKPTRFSAPRNAPLFANIRYKVDCQDLKTTIHLDESYPNFYNVIKDGNYYTAMFEDNICDGFISAQIQGVNSRSIIKRMASNIFPAFSLVTAPDFFPYIDSFDLLKFDQSKDRSFMIGGTENLSTCRLRANPNLIDPIKKNAAFPKEELFLKKGVDLPYTMHAVITQKLVPTNKMYDLSTKKFKHPEERDYLSTSYMTDTASFIFAPGWDATYSENEKNQPYLATIGLGSPFPEDMKLCAAANGMWPVASPDSARTYQGSLEPTPTNEVTPCAIPLTDFEIGIHENHPMLKEAHAPIKSCFGWDGEHGPYLNQYENRFCVEFTDIARTDYVSNVLDRNIGFNAERLRELSPQEIINRMEALRKCKLALEGRKHEFSKYWLVSVEPVNWESGAMGIGIPLNLIGNHRNWAIKPQHGIHGSGYLFVFVDPQYQHKIDPVNYDWVGDRRRRLQIKNIYVCQIAKNKISYCQILPEGNQNFVKWNEG